MSGMYDAGWADGWAGRESRSHDEDYEVGYSAGCAEWTAIEKREAQRDE